MNSYIPKSLSRFLALGAITTLAVTCGGTEPATTGATTAPTSAPAASVAAAASPVQGQAIAHKAGATHAQQPKRLEAVFEVDMYENYFAGPDGAKNPTFTLPTGKTIGLHFHNEGTTMHEFAIGRTAKKDGGYEKGLFEAVSADVFFYYGAAKSEIGGATFEEIEVEPGLRDVWLRFTVPAQLKGEWEIGCFAPEHYEKGMHAKVIFQ